MLKILSISRDLSIFRDGSVARERMVRYGSICDELHIIIPANNLQLTTHNRKTQISKNVFAYPSFGLNKFMALVKVYSVGLKILDLKLKGSFILEKDGFSMVDITRTINSGYLKAPLVHVLSLAKCMKVLV